MTNVGFANFASASQAPLQLVFSQLPRLFCLFNVSGERLGFDCSNVMFSGMSRDSGCNLIHPDPNEATTSCFISSAVVGILFTDLFTTSLCIFINSSGAGIPSSPPQVAA